MLFRKMTDFYDAAMGMSDGCIVTLDNTGTILSFNSYLEKISKKTTNGFIGKSWFDIFVSVKEESHLHFKNAILQGEKADQIHKILTCYENGLFIEWNFMLVNGSDKSQSGILGAGQDVSRHVLNEKKEDNDRHLELERQLHHSDRLATVGQLAAGIAHELNGPLNNILGYAQLSSKQQDLPEQVYLDLDNIIRFSLHAREIVKKVMLFSRQMPPKHESVNLNKVVEESLYFTEPLCRQNNIEILSSLSEDLPEIMADFSQLRQVIVNLLVNAAQAISKDGGKIKIKTKFELGKNISLTIEDTGAGMRSETLMQCFMPFFTTKDVDQGTGLGLSVVHGIIQVHNGTITADSTQGKGSRFYITFPLESGKGEKDG
ncbi:MAG: hypothetical protein GY710_13325 [Desulfobacteraceae bacterium]|nr:hypothetical protein [Desulfobacteraceae bacterium]